MDRESRLEFLGAWRDVRDKAKRIRAEGGVYLISSNSPYYVASVKGDTDVYETMVMYVPGTRQVAMWSCGCKWADYSWGRSGRWKKYEGRQCSHSLALNFDLQARGMYGKEVREDRESPEWAKGVKPVAPEAFGPPGAWRVSSLHDPLRQRRLARGYETTLKASEARTGRSGPQSWELPPVWRLAPARVGYALVCVGGTGVVGTTQRIALPALDPDDAQTPEGVAQWYFDTAADEEPNVTRLIVQLAEHNAGKAEGLEFRVKGYDSLLRKIRDRWNRGGDPRTWISDALRYTIVFHPADYSQQVMDVLYGMDEAGYKTDDGENSWPKGDSYSGLHYTLWTSDGFGFELQFHTQDSYDLKNVTLHKLYEEFRESSTPVDRKRDLYDAMTKYWDNVDVPDDVLGWGELKHYDRP